MLLFKRLSALRRFIRKPPIFKHRRGVLFILITLSLGMVVWQPWIGLELEGRGISYGAEMEGGYWTLVELESSLITIEVPEGDLDGAWAGIAEALGGAWGPTLLSKNPSTQQLLIEIDGWASEEYLRNLVGAYGEILEVRVGISASTVNETVSAFQRRFDPHGLKGVRVRPVESEAFRIPGHEGVKCFEEASMVIETPVDFLPTVSMTKRGWVEVAVENQILVTSADIVGVDRASLTPEGWGVPVFFTEEGEDKINAGIVGAADRPMVAYVDRPFDAVLLFDEIVVGGLFGLTYDENENLFWMERDPYAPEPELFCPLLVSAVANPGKDNLSPDVWEYLEEHADTKVRAIILGSEDDFRENFLDGIPKGYEKVFVPLMRPGLPRPGIYDRMPDEWISDVCGLELPVPVDPLMAVRGIERGGGILLAVRGPAAEPATREDAEALRTVIRTPLPTRTKFLGQGEFGTRYESIFDRGVIASVLGIFGVSILALCQFRRFWVGVLFFIILMCDLIIVLGLVSVMGLAVSLAEMAGVCFVLAISASQMLVITGEAIGRTREEGAGIGSRIPKALGLTFASSITSILDRSDLEQPRDG
jgi:hypothetical protein